MSNFLKNSNKAGLVGSGLMVFGALLFIWWATSGEGNGVGNFFGSAWILAVVIFLAGVAVIASKSGRGQS